MAANKKLPALKVHQWMKEWDNVIWDDEQFRKKPLPWFYLFSVSAKELKLLSGIYPRTTKDRRSGKEDLGIQRRHEKNRSEEISKFAKYGYPWSDLTEKKRESGEYSELQKPGWLPTAIVINILEKDDVRREKKVASNDLLKITDINESTAEIAFPNSLKSDDPWSPTSIPPIEIIDGQHRLWAFEDIDESSNFQLPVVAFLGLDISWQAYLFYTINIKPKRINASLAFDLYPLLRTEDWLDKFEGHVIYRETRAQEIVDILWSYEKSPWHKHINMLGESGIRGKMVSQAAWIRSLLATYIKSWEGRGVRIGGLFGSQIGSHNTVLPWIKEEQAALIIYIGQLLLDELSRSDIAWVRSLSEENEKPPAFYGKHSLLNQDQGIRVLLHITNDFLYLNSDMLGLDSWGGANDSEDSDNRITTAISSLKKNKKIKSFLKSFIGIIAVYDWRASSASNLSDDEKSIKASFRGSGGYKELRKSVLKHIQNTNTEYASIADSIIDALGY